METNNTKREISKKRAEELKKYTIPFLNYKKEQNKIIEERTKKAIKCKEKIIKIFNATEEQWNDWKWQLKNRITDIELLKKILDLDERRIKRNRRSRKALQMGSFTILLIFN